MNSHIRNILIGVSLGVLLTSADKETCSGDKCIGQSEQLYELDPELTKITGMSFQEDLSGGYLYLLDGHSKKIATYKVNTINGDLIFQESIPLKSALLRNPRGLVYSKEATGNIFYFLDYFKGREDTVYSSRLYRYDPGNKDLSYLDLTNENYGIGSKETFGIAKQQDDLYVSFDPSGYSDQVERIRRGILKISIKDREKMSSRSKSVGRPVGWEEALAGQPATVKHLPGPGKSIHEKQVEASLALATMSIDGVDYLWGTVGSENIYLLDSETGRGIFFFDMPESSASTERYHSGMTFGANHLWVTEPNSKKAVVHRINVLDNPGLAYKGPKRFREIRMRLTSVVKDQVTTPRGLAYHTFLHPFPANVLGRQGVISNSVHVNDLTNAVGCDIGHLYYYPGGDTASRQDYTLVTYNTELNQDIRKYQTDFAIKVWMREYKHFIYPHLVKESDGPPGTSYLEDDEVLYKYKEDPEIYRSFMKRVRDYIASEYGTDPKMDNPYWVSRNITEYVVENYHYPKDEEGFYATYDFEEGNFNSNPGNLKAELSADDRYEDNIIACSGTGAMLCGALRSVGIPATWIGVSQEHDWKQWETEDGDEFLEFNEESSVGNGHRYNHVWLGDFYRWQRFDATPARPNGIDFDKKPEEVSQWALMRKSAAGVEAHRVVHTIQSEFWSKLHNAFADCEEHVNSCGATRYNLLGTYTYPEDFNLSRNTIRYRAIQFIQDIRVDLDKDLKGLVSWKTIGEWNLDNDAKLDVTLEKKRNEEQMKVSPGYEHIAVLARGIPVIQTSVKLDMNKLEPGIYRVIVAKAGDPVTGNWKSFEIAK